eukprot:scaffold127454_cov54-Phaeocystis_antarctica.AAC.1
MNSHLSTSSKRAKRTGSLLSASLPITRMSVSRCRVVERSPGDLLWESDRTGREAKRYIVRTNGARRGSLQDGQPVQGSGEETERGVWSSVRGGRSG